MGNSAWTMNPVDDKCTGLARVRCNHRGKRTPMKRLCVLMIGVWLGVGTGSAHAQFPWNLNPFRRTAPAPPPAERVSQLLATIKNEADERKRVLAVEEIRDFDTKQYPEIVSV